ncbi:MFS transporter [Actinoplanes sp. OR16]|uniref:MFS transporter n=1 Tax=Actinoplanes sp. OR16 TaxID=946334 RepID=UPI000F700093|nr:MFS transporter [Actinoplanes sp. OR16]BBH63324.1 MFS transporter [Actinoplanes sp. OR16]
MSNNATGVRQRPHAVALTVLATTQLMLVLDGAVVNIALPSMQSDLGLSDSALAWVVNGYVLAGGGLLLLGGRAGDLFGRRRVFIIGMWVFTLASLIGGFATTGELLITTRVLQGVGGALAGPNAVALISTTFPVGPARSRALAVNSAAAGAGTAIGLIAGGLLTDAFSWRAVMLVNVPFGAAVLLSARRVLSESDPQHGAFDLLGAVLGSAGLGALVLGISLHGDPLALGLSVVTLTGFLWRQARTPRPLLPLRLFRDRDRSSAYLVILLVGGSLSLTYFLSLHVQHVMGYSPVRAGLAFLPFAAGIAGGSWLAARSAGRFAPRVVTGTGLLLAVAGALSYRTFDADSAYLSDLLVPMLVWSTGMGMTFVPMTATVLSRVPEPDTGIASAVMGTMQQVGGAVGLAVLVAVATAVQGGSVSTDAEVRGYAAAYTTSLVLLLLAMAVTLTIRRPHEGRQQ